MGLLHVASSPLNSSVVFAILHVASSPLNSSVVFTVTRLFSRWFQSMAVFIARRLKCTTVTNQETTPATDIPLQSG
jgi:hypothetical protein